jgi:dihydroorotase
MDMLLKNVLAFRDGAWKPTDIAVGQGKIEAVRDAGAERIATEVAPAGAGGASGVETRDLSGLYASAGWVDLHTHLLPLRYGGVGTHAEKIGLRTGVTALCDAGTVGAETFGRLRDKVIADARVPVKCLLNIKRTGIRFWKVGSNEPGLDDVPAMVKLKEAHPELVAGVKVTASKEHMLDSDPRYFVKKAVEAGAALKLPVMVHIGRTPPSLREILPLLRPGDIITHCFRNGGHTILDPSGKVRGDVREAAARGVLFDVGHGVKSFSFPVAEQALAQGFPPTSISTDLYMLSTPYRAISFANVLTKFLALGMKLEDLMDRASTAPAAAMGLSRGLEPGRPACITLFKVVDDNGVLKDCWNQARPARQRIVPSCVIHEGKFMHCN